MKKIVFAAGTVLVIAVAALAFHFLRPAVSKKIGDGNVITASRLEQAVNISQLSTSEFVYNGIADKYRADTPDTIQCHIAYNANVKVGIRMDDISFQIDEKNKRVTPILPDITVNSVSLDEGSISYIPQNPDISLKEVISICREDAMTEAGSSLKLYETAEDNLKAVVEALLMPILDSAGYSLSWEMGQ